MKIADIVEFERIAVREMMLARRENMAVFVHHAGHWAVILGLIGTLVWFDVGGLASAARSAVTGWEILLPLLSMAAALWIGFSNYRRDRELIEIERRFLLLEIEGLRRDNAG